MDNNGIFDGLWRGEMKCLGPEAKEADLRMEIWEEGAQNLATSNRHVIRKLVVEGGLAQKTVRHWVVRWKEMQGLQNRRQAE